MTSPHSDDSTSIASDQPRALPAPLSSAGGWHLLPGQAWSELGAREAALAKVFIDLFPAAVAATSKLHCLAEGSSAYVILGGEHECADWGMSKLPLGFHAVLSDRREDEETDEEYFDVNERNEAVINLEALAHTIAEDGADLASLEAGLVTMPHEMAHIAAWLIASQGRTPLQVFDDEGGEWEVKKMLDQIEKDAHGRGAETGLHGHSEDEAETFGRDVVDNWAPPSPEASDNLASALKLFAQPARAFRPR